jgi:hypothetical protein
MQKLTRKSGTSYFLSLLTVLLISSNIFAGNYKNFTVSVYARAYEVRQMQDDKWLDSAWTVISQQLKVDKIYIETHRDNIIVDEAIIKKVKQFFESKGIKTAGGITYTMNERNRFQTFCYSNPDERKKAKEIAELTARNFDEFILDDFFFTSCKCDLCIAAKGTQSWTDFRLKLMTEAAENLIIKPAKAINPKVKVVIKYPNWYEHFQGLGFNLETEPKLFDGIYTGTETRDPVLSNQHLQQYESYLIYRYFNNLKPGFNGGGWVDPFGSMYLDRYAEQLWLTLFAKAPEITLFDFRMMLAPINQNQKAKWQNGTTSFNFDQMMQPIEISNKKTILPTSYARPAGYTFENIDKTIGFLGNPIGIKSYKPYHSKGEDFIQNFFGMMGIPMDIVPEFPVNDKMVILTESASYDSEIVKKIKDHLAKGNNVLITSGLLKALQGKGIEDIVELKVTGNAAGFSKFLIGWNKPVEIQNKIFLPQIQYFTNDSWEDISVIDGEMGWPILHQANYSKGNLFVLTIPENVADLYNFPETALNRIRQVVSQDVNVRLEGPSKVCLFVYDNNTFIIESFLPEEIDVSVKTNASIENITDCLTNNVIKGVKEKESPIWRISKDRESSKFMIKLKPHSYRVFKY